MSTTDQTHLAHLAAQAQAAQDSRARQKQTESAAREEGRQRIAVARQVEIFTDLFGPRTASHLGITFQWDARYQRALGTCTHDGAERLLFYDGDRGLLICIPGVPLRATATGYYGMLPTLEQAQNVDLQRDHAEQLILAFASTFASTD